MVSSFLGWLGAASASPHSELPRAPLSRPTSHIPHPSPASFPRFLPRSRPLLLIPNSPRATPPSSLPPCVSPPPPAAPPRVPTLISKFQSGRRARRASAPGRRERWGGSEGEGREGEGRGGEGGRATPTVVSVHSLIWAVDLLLAHARTHQTHTHAPNSHTHDTAADLLRGR